MAKAAKTGSAGTAGYSGTPLPQKLGQKPGQRALFIALPDGLERQLTATKFLETRLTPTVNAKTSKGPFDYVHLFTTKRATLAGSLPLLKERLAADGMIWVSWPKKAAKIETDITEDTIREVCLPMGLVDVKVCAVDETWSGLKLMIRKELRNRKANSK
jgi:hypothetical protein